MTWHSWDWKEPSMGETDCARMKATGYGMWEDFDCDTNTNMWAFCMRAKCKQQVCVKNHSMKTWKNTLFSKIT